jgi:hypothetical protein
VLGLTLLLRLWLLLLDQVGKDGLESYHMDYDVIDMADVKRVEEL